MPRANRVAAYAAAFATAVRNGLAYPGELAVGCVFMVVIFFIFANLWPAAYAGREQVEGLTLAQLLIYLVATETLVMTPRVWNVIQAEIRSGDVAIHWARPIDYGLWHLAGFLGEAVVRAPLTFAVGAAIVWLRTGVRIPVTQRWGPPCVLWTSPLRSPRIGTADPSPSRGGDADT